MDSGNGTLYCIITATKTQYPSLPIMTETAEQTSALKTAVGHGLLIIHPTGLMAGIGALQTDLSTKGIRQGALCVYTLQRNAQIQRSVCYFRAKRVTLVKNTRNATANHRFLQLALSIRRSGNGNAQSRLLLSQTGLPHNSVYREVEP